jgi:phage repressor protein C with HTH and peptisase S24 domain
MDESGKEYQAIAREAGVSRPGTGSAWLRDAVPGGRALMRLPQILGVSGHWLLTGEGPMRPDNEDREAEAFRRIAQIVREAEAPTTVPAATVGEEVRKKLARLGGGGTGDAKGRRSRGA